MSRFIFEGLAAVALLAVSSGVVSAQQSFPVCLQRTGSSVCEGNNTTATEMSIAPTTGAVTLRGVEGLGSGLPGGATGLGNITWNITPLNPAASGDNVTVIVQNIPAGASCTMRPVTTELGSGSIGGDGWTDGALLPLNGAGTASLPRNLAMSASTAGWEVKLNVQCSIATSDGYFVYGPVMSSPKITVPPAQIVVTGDCPYVDGSGDMVPPGHDGLTTASRHLTVSATNGPNGNGNYDALNYTSLYLANAGGGTVGGRLLASPGSANEGYGWPGTYFNNVTKSIQTGKFVALKFRAPSHMSWKGISFFLRTWSPEFNGVGVTWAIAPCPGQFRSVVPGQSGVPAGSPQVNVPAACVANDPATKGTGIYTIVSDPANPYTFTGFGAKCPIEMGKTYYLNMIAADALAPGHLNPQNANNHTWCRDDFGNPKLACNVRTGSAGLVLDPNYQ